MRRDYVWLVIVIILGGSTFALLNPDRDGDASQTQNSSILSAYHGLDQLPLVASVLCGFNVAGDDGMPVVFSTQLNVDSVDPESFLVTRSDGEVVVPNCATLHPADEPLELRTVLLTGDFGTFGETPLRVEVTGPLLTIDGESLLGLSTEDITPLEDGPRVVLAERFTPETPGLAGECPDGTAQVVQLTWEGGVTGPANAELGEDQRLGTLVLLEDGTTVNPVALVDDDPDNHVLACLAEESPAQSVEVHAGLFHDPGDDANPATHAEVADDPDSDHLVNADDYNVLYIGHSFGRGFAELLEGYAHTAGETNHAQYMEFSGGVSGSPSLLWEDAEHQANIKALLDTGEIDVLIMICCSPEFIQTLDTDQAVWNFTDYAVEKSPDIRIGLAMPWKDFPGDYENASEYATNSTLDLYPYWGNLSDELRADYPGTDVFTFHHGAIAYEMREMFEAGDLDEDVEQLQGPKATSLFTDEKGHAGDILVDTGTLIWLHAVYGVDPMDMPEFSQWETDIRVIAERVLEEKINE